MHIHRFVRNLNREVGRGLCLFDALHPSQQFSDMSGCLPVLNQYNTEDKASYSRAKHSASVEARTLDLESSMVATFDLASAVKEV